MTTSTIVINQELSPIYGSLLGLAEKFRTSNPPNIRSCVQCLRAILQFRLNPKLEARTHFQLGCIIWKNTSNLDIAKGHLEKAWHLGQGIKDDTILFEIASILSKIYSSINGRNDDAKLILRAAIEKSKDQPYWRCLLLFQISENYIADFQYDSACQMLTIGADYTYQQKAYYTQGLFLLSKAMVFLMNKKNDQLSSILAASARCIEHQNSQYHRESLRTFYLFLDVYQHLITGRVKTCKPVLKQLQQAIQCLTNMTEEDEKISNNIDRFQWMPKDQICVVVYLVTIIHSLQAGCVEKAAKYTEKALSHVNSLKLVESTESPKILNCMELLLFEQVIQCKIISGNQYDAIKGIMQTRNHISEFAPVLLKAHSSQLHTLIGLYAMSMNCMESAESQFNLAIKTADDDLKTFIKLNLIICFLRMNRKNDVARLIEECENFVTCNQEAQSLKASLLYVKGLQGFFENRFHDSKRMLRESIKIANGEELNRLTACDLVLLGHIFCKQNNTTEALNMINPSMQLASKIPDKHVQLWASFLLKAIYDQLQDNEKVVQYSQQYKKFSEVLLKDYLHAGDQPEHKLVEWLDN